MVTVLSAADRVVRGVETTAIQWLRATAIHTEPHMIRYPPST